MWWRTAAPMRRLDGYDRPQRGIAAPPGVGDLVVRIRYGRAQTRGQPIAARRPLKARNREAGASTQHELPQLTGEQLHEDPATGFRHRRRRKPLREVFGARRLVMAVLQ